MKINDIICGFKVDRARENAELGGTLYEMTHIKTGASLIWLDNKDSNKHFSIAFKTPPSDDTGVFHILEHSVLNGSKKYTVKDPFLELIKSSMNTFLNAMTSCDYTIYPVSSRNDQDFFNLVSVYLDAVFCPAIYTNPNIFYQEGWHYELNNADENPTYKGVVFNEMKGVFASPDSQLQSGLYKLMFHDTCYQYESGGAPTAIPDLTYDSFIANHKKYYHPSNARIWLDGDIDLDRILTLIDSEYLSGYDKENINTEIPKQEPVENVRLVGTYQAEDGEKSYLSFGKVLCRFDEKIKRFALNILASYLTGNNDSPIKKAVLSNGIAQDIYMYLDESCQDQPFVTVAKQIDVERENEFWQVLLSVKNDILKNGIDKNELDAIINQIEFATKEIDEPKALGRNMMAMSTWLYDGDPMDMLVFDELFKEIRELVNTDYFEKLLEEIPLAPNECAVYLMLPSTTKDEELLEEEKRTLEEARKSWTEEKINEILELNKSLVAWQREENTAEDLATLPTLPLSAVNPEPICMPTEVKDGIIFHKTKDNGITNVNLYFSLTGFDEKDYGALSFLTNLLGELPTKSTDLSSLMRRVKATIGYIDYNASAYSKLGDNDLCHSYFSVSFSVLNQKLTDAIKLVCEIINETDFENENSKSLIKDILAQSIYAMQDGFISQGNKYARMRAASHIIASAKATDMLEGYGFYEWLKSFNESIDDRYLSFVELMNNIQKSVFNRDNMIISVASSELSDEIKNISNRLYKTEGDSVPEFVKLELNKSIKSEAIQIPGGVSYASLVDNLYNYGMAVNGRMSALSTLMSYQYLWNEIRVLGGAYGCGMAVPKNGNIMFSSYRDPNPKNSQNVFKKSSDFIREYVKSDANFDNIIISAAASLEPLIATRREQLIADLDYFYGITVDDKRKQKHQLLEMKKDDLLEFCDILDKVAENGFSCTVAPKAHIDTLDVKKVNTL